MSDPTPAPVNPPAKSMIQSTTGQGVSIAGLGAVVAIWSLGEKVLGHQALSDTEKLTLVTSVVTVGGCGVAYFGRFKAEHPVTGWFRVKKPS